MTDSTQGKMARGAVWMVMFKLIERGMGLISTLILARLLSPGDFGTVAMALSFIIMAELLSAFSFDVAIIHNQSATPAHFNSAWTCNFLLGFAITLIFGLIANYFTALWFTRLAFEWIIAKFQPARLSI